MIAFFEGERFCPGYQGESEQSTKSSQCFHQLMANRLLPRAISSDSVGQSREVSSGESMECGVLTAECGIA
jgi:hypothetical protein